MLSLKGHRLRPSSDMSRKYKKHKDLFNHRTKTTEVFKKAKSYIKSMFLCYGDYSKLTIKESSALVVRFSNDIYSRGLRKYSLNSFILFVHACINM